MLEKQNSQRQLFLYKGCANYMKKPFIKIKSPFDALKLALSVAFMLGAVSLFFTRRDAAVLSSGGYDGVRGLYNLVSSWI